MVCTNVFNLHYKGKLTYFKYHEIQLCHVSYGMSVTFFTRALPEFCKTRSEEIKLYFMIEDNSEVHMLECDDGFSIIKVIFRDSRF